MKLVFGALLFKKITFLFLTILFFSPSLISAESNTKSFSAEIQNSPTSENEAIKQEGFRAIVSQVIKESEENENYFQDLVLTGKTGTFKDKEISYLGYTEKISSNHRLKKGDVVFMLATKTENKNIFAIQDRSRLPALFWITLAFVVTIYLVTRKHGLKALFSLLITFAVVIGFVVPRVLAGAEPLTTVVLSSIVIVVSSLLIIHGWNNKSKIAISGVLSGVLITVIISELFINFAHLTGGTAEEAMFLTEFLNNNINFSGLLLASFILGALGILDDIAITQTSIAKEISETDKTLKPKEIFKKSMTVGVDHIASMINTLFLAYAGASFTLLLLFGLNQAPFVTFTDVINNELVATEIIRTLVGSIGLILTVPITTFIAAQVYGKKEKSA